MSLPQLVIVLFEPQDPINIGSVVRVAENFGVGTVRLVRPLSSDPDRILITAPRAEERIASLEIFDDLEEAVSDCDRVYGLSARSRRGHMELETPTGMAGQLRDYGRVAFVFGREDSGLPNEALDRCDVLVKIPTNPTYSSLNLAQAVLLCVWEAWRVNTGDETDVGREVAPRGQVERMLQMADLALERVEFFKGDNREHVMRSVRHVFARAGLDERELAIWFGIWREIPAYIRRKSKDHS